ncbi:unnamed protein product [Caenorhabditis auriculariae]|uniref:Uncharacterized protein n=1 Tax=Caenorhabditis auriculariae TaxID=2777116 RepID=A0A8S1GW19_9PELO|nr:unnamed protein product [Caenorhabditis auriculariae]
MTIVLLSCMKQKRTVQRETSAEQSNFGHHQILTQTHQTDDLANVEFLTPTLGVACCDDQASHEAQMRHNTLTYHPHLILQPESIRDNTTDEEIKKLLAKHPKHPTQKFRATLNSAAEEKRKRLEREAKWKNIHVKFHKDALVYIVRSTDAARAREDDGGDTADTLTGKERDAAMNDEENQRTPSEIAMTEPEGKDKKLAKELAKLATNQPEKTVDTTQQSSRKEKKREEMKLPPSSKLPASSKMPASTKMPLSGEKGNKTIQSVLKQPRSNEETSGEEKKRTKPSRHSN